MKEALVRQVSKSVSNRSRIAPRSSKRMFFPDSASLYASVPPPGPVPIMRRGWEQHPRWSFAPRAEGRCSLMISVLAQRAASEGPRWTRAVEDQSAPILEEITSELGGSILKWAVVAQCAQPERLIRPGSFCD